MEKSIVNPTLINERPSKYFEFKNETITLDTDEQKYQNIFVPSEQQIWLISEYHIEVWNLKTKERVHKRDKPLKKFHLRTTFINKHTIATISQISSMNQHCELITYNIETQQIKTIVQFPLNTNSELYSYQDFQFMYYFQITNKLIIGSIEQDLLRFYYINLNQEQNQQFKIKKYYNYSSYQNLQFDDTGIICQFSRKQVINQCYYKFQLIQQNSSQIYTFQSQKQQCIADVNQRFNDEVIIVMKKSNNNNIIFYNTQKRFIIKQISLIFNVTKLMKFKGFFVSISTSEDEYVIQECSLDFVYSFYINCIGKRVMNKYIPIVIHHENKNNTKTIISTVKIDYKHKVKSIILMENSRIEEIFGNEIIKQVVNFTSYQQ